VAVVEFIITAAARAESPTQGRLVAPINAFSRKARLEHAERERKPKSGLNILLAPAGSIAQDASDDDEQAAFFYPSRAYTIVPPLDCYFDVLGSREAGGYVVSVGL
jgi:hypothetical protein